MINEIKYYLNKKLPNYNITIETAKRFNGSFLKIHNERGECFMFIPDGAQIHKIWFEYANTISNTVP